MKDIANWAGSVTEFQLHYFLISQFTTSHFVKFSSQPATLIGDGTPSSYLDCRIFFPGVCLKVGGFAK
ncbi:MAG: hypothetical protein EBY22_11780 [Gammaproteobacteria bacterium]|nr:hypothetical protein [Gammaproteobacteria bacterium]